MFFFNNQQSVKFVGHIPLRELGLVALLGVAMVVAAGCASVSDNGCDTGFTLSADGARCEQAVTPPTCAEPTVLDVQSGECVLLPGPTNVTLFGVVTDAITGFPLEGAAVAILPFVNEQVVTDALGVFSSIVELQKGALRVSWSADGYIGQSQALLFDYQTDGQSVDLSRSLQPVPPDLPDDDDGGAVATYSVAGAIYAGFGAASGASVWLTNLDGSVSEMAHSDLSGRFAFAGLLDDTYTIIAGAWDRDGDGIDDYRRTVVPLRPANVITEESLLSAAGDGTMGINITNLVIPLDAIVKEVAFTNLLGRGSSFSNDGDVHSIDVVDNSQNPEAEARLSNLRLRNVGDDIIFHFGAEVDTAATEVSLMSFDADPDNSQDRQYGAVLSLSTTWSADSVVLTINPEVDLTADADPNTGYELRFTTFVWADGDAPLPPEVGPEHYFAIRFDVDLAPAPIDAAVAQVYVDDLGKPASVGCDEYSCTLTDHNDDDHERTSFNLVWPHVEGAQSYQIYVRTVKSVGGQEISSSPEVASFASMAIDYSEDGTAARGFATGVLGEAGDGRRWSDLYDNGFGPLAGGARVELWISAIYALADHDGGQNEEWGSAADYVVSFADTTSPSIDTVSFAVTESTLQGAKIDVSFSFSEHIDNTDDVSLVWFNDTTEFDAAGLNWSSVTLNGEERSVFGGQVEVVPPDYPCSFVNCDIVAEDEVLCIEQPELFDNSDKVVLLDGTGAIRSQADTTVINTAADGFVSLSRAVEGDYGAGVLMLCAAAAAASPALNQLAADIAAADTKALFGSEMASTLAPGDQLLLLNPSANESAVLTVATVDSSLGEVGFAATGMDFVASETVFMRFNAIGVDYSAALDIVDIIVTADASEHSFTFVDFGDANPRVGDLLRIDADGDESTAADTYYGTVIDVRIVNDDPATPDSNERARLLVVGEPPLGFTAIPAGDYLHRDRASVTLFGDYISIESAASIISDTSANSLSGIASGEGTAWRFGFCNTSCPDSAVDGVVVF